MSNNKKPFTSEKVLWWWLLTSIVLFINYDVWFGNKKFWNALEDFLWGPMIHEWFWIIAIMVSIITAIDHFVNKK